MTRTSSLFSVGAACLLLASQAVAAPQPTVEVCHPAGNSGQVLELQVNGNALGAHVDHGDWSPIVFFEDADEDGYGDAAYPVEACEQPAGTATSDDDCNDDDDLVNPGSTEVPGNGVDDDCDPTTSDVPARTWNAADDFAPSNPNGAWAYGYTDPIGGFTPFASYGNSGGLSWWNRGYFWLQVYANTTASTYGNCGDWCLQPGTVAMHPDNSSLKAVTRFTAPSTGNYDVDGAFTPIDRQSYSIEVWVAHNGAIVAHGYLGAWWTDLPFDLTVAAQAGDTIDFIVGRGAGGYANDGTDLDATVYGPW